jgi:hypothetical protein
MIHFHTHAETSRNNDSPRLRSKQAIVLSSANPIVWTNQVNKKVVVSEPNPTAPSDNAGSKLNANDSTADATAKTGAAVAVFEAMLAASRSFKFSHGE